MAEHKHVYIHIGAPKTGTTYLQKVLSKNRDAMEQAGVLYPRVGLEAHHGAVWDLRGRFDGTEDDTKFTGSWDELVRQSNDWDGHSVVISSEMFVYATKDECKRILGSFDAADVHVIYSARDLVRQVPAVWQEQIKNRRVMRYSKFLDDLLGKRKTRMAKHFWEAQDAATALDRWSQGLPPSQVHVVTAPPSGSPPDLLWTRFASVVGLDPAMYPSDIPAANESLSVTATEVLRRYNERYGKDIPILRFRSQVRSQLLPALVEAVEDKAKLPLDYDQRTKIVDLSEEIVRKLRKAGYDVAGDLDELVPDRPGRKDKKPPRGPDDLSEDEVNTALIDVLNHVVEQNAKGRRPQKQ